jgi:hypothetical protein
MGWMMPYERILTPSSLPRLHGQWTRRLESGAQKAGYVHYNLDQFTLFDLLLNLSIFRAFFFIIDVITLCEIPQ